MEVLNRYIYEGSKRDQPTEFAIMHRKRVTMHKRWSLL